MTAAYKRSLLKAYENDKQWNRILEAIRDKDRSTIGQFEIQDGLLYYRNEENRRIRLCVAKRLEQKVYEVAHDQQSHAGFHRAYHHIAKSIYIRKLSKRLS